MPPRAAPPPSAPAVPAQGSTQINDAYDVITALEIQDDLDSMPVELTKSLADLRELDAVLNATIAHMTSRISSLTRAIRDPALAPHERFKLLVEIGDEASRFKLGGDDKVRVAGIACELMIHHQVRINDLLQASTLLAPDPAYNPVPAPLPHLTARRPRGSPMPARAVPAGGSAGAVGETTPSKKRKIGVTAGAGAGAGAGVAASREEERDETYGAAKKVVPKDKKIGAIKRKTTTARASPTPSLAQSTTAPPLPTTSASGRAQRPNAGRNRQYDDDAPVAPGLAAALADEDDAGSYGSPARSLGAAGGTAAARKSTARGGSARKDDAAAKPKPLGASAVQLAVPALADEMDVDDPEHEADAEGETGEDQKTYCYCHGLSAGEMIGCDAEDCPIEWFHLVCLDLTEAPVGDWLCPECTKRLESKGGKGKNGRGAAAGKAAKGKVKR